MTRTALAYDIALYLTNNLPLNGPYYPDEWGKGTDGKVITKQVLIQDSLGQTSDVPQAYERPIFTLTFRGSKDETTQAAFDRAVVVHDFLVQAQKVTINATDYDYFDSFAPLQMLSSDDKGSPMLFSRYLTLRAT